MTPVQQIVLAYTLETAFAALLLFAFLFILFDWLGRRRKPFPMRPIPAYERIRSLALESVEAGQPMHFGLGGGEWTQAAPELVAGLTAWDYACRQAARAEQEVCVTTGNPVTLLLAMNLLQANRARVGAPAGRWADELGFYGPEPLAYAGGAASEGRRRAPIAHALVGRFGDEGLWLAEALRPGNAPVLGGTGNPAAVALMQLAIEHPIVGEDLFAAGAYLHRRQHLASLEAQDWMRLLLALAALTGALLASLGVGG